MLHKGKSSKHLLAVLLISCSCPSIAAAQVTAEGAVEPADQAKQDTTADASTDGDIIVTAQRRSQSLQQVPIAVTAISPEIAEKLNLRDLKSLQQVTPGLTYTSGINYVQTYIRGVGSDRTNPGLEPAVATYIDGSYVERGFGSLFDVLDPASIQVLKGPQGTLWGRNATGGALIITTADPEFDSSGRFVFEKGNYDHTLVEGVLNSALDDRLAIRVAARYRTDDGYVRNLTDGRMLGGQETIVARAKVIYKPVPDFVNVFQFQYDYSKRGQAPNQQALSGVFCGFCSGSSFTYPLSDGYTTANNTLNGGVGGKDSTYFLNWRSEYDNDAFAVTGVLGYRKSNNYETGDFDMTDVPAFNIIQYSGAKTFTGELNLTTKWDGMLNIIGGISYLNDRSYIDAQVYADSTRPPLGSPGLANVTTKSISGYAEATVTPVDKVSIILGGRYTRDTRKLPGTTLTFNSFTPRAVLSYDAGDANFYVSYNEGFKSGGLGSFAPPFQTVDPEKIKSYEAGLKYVSPDRQFRANLSAFWYKYTGLQVTVQDIASGLSTLQNAGAARGRGVEVDFSYRPMTNIEFFGGGSYLDAIYTSYPAAQLQNPVFNAAGVPTALGVSVGDLSGTRLPRAPKWTGFIGATLQTPIGESWKGEVSLFGNYTSSFDFTAGSGGSLRADTQPGYGMVKLSGKVSPEDDRYSIGFYVDNLTNTKYYDFAFTLAPFGAIRNIARPRTYGIRLGLSL